MAWIFAFAVLIVVGVGGWTMYMPLADRTPVMQFLSNEQFNDMYLRTRLYLAGQWVFPIAAVVAAVLSVWAWRRGRV